MITSDESDIVTIITCSDIFCKMYLNRKIHTRKQLFFMIFLNILLYFSTSRIGFSNFENRYIFDPSENFAIQSGIYVRNECRSADARIKTVLCVCDLFCMVPNSSYVGLSVSVPVICEVSSSKRLMVMRQGEQIEIQRMTFYI